jgi:hypothetical protein
MMLGILKCNLLGIFDKFEECYDLTYREIMDYKEACDILERIFKAFKKKPGRETFRTMAAAERS